MRARPPADGPRLRRWHARCSDRVPQERAEQGEGTGGRCRCLRRRRCGVVTMTSGRARPGPDSLPTDHTEARADAVTPRPEAPKTTDDRVRAPSPGRRDVRGRAAVGRDDLVRLNSLLGGGLRFEVDTIRPRETGHASVDGRTGDERPRGRSYRVVGTLFQDGARGAPRSASYPVSCSHVRRQLLHSLAGSLAECAMILGLGAGVYGGSLGVARRRDRESA